MPENLDSYLQLTVARNLVKYAAGRAMFCPKCETVLDAPTTVYADDGDGGHTLILCATCWGKSPGNVRAGSITVWDGRVLWAKPQRKFVYIKSRQRKGR